MLKFPDNPLLKPTVPPTPRNVEREALARENEELRLKLLKHEMEIGELKSTIVRQQERIQSLEFQLRNLVR